MNFSIHIPEPVLWVVGTIVVLIVLKLLANLILPGND
jgi:hypothetical protein